jgi:hypothetical protein
MRGHGLVNGSNRLKMNTEDHDRLVTLIALVVIGVPLDDALKMSAAKAEVVLEAWRSINPVPPEKAN